MKKKQTIGLIIAAVVFAAVGIVSVWTNTFFSSTLEQSMADTAELLTGDFEFDAPDENYIAVVEVTGTIQEQAALGIFDTAEGYQHTTTMEYIDNLMYDPNNVGILLYVDSPGGTVYESVELYNKLIEYKENTGNSVWAYMAYYAASGGYMASVAADYIFANENTTTGSIGVIMSGYDMTGLYEKLGIRYVSITSGENKDSSRLTDEQIAIYQSQIDECFKDFVSKVAEGRAMDEEEVLALADGRTYTARQALANGLIDEISSYDEMQQIVCDEAGTWTIYQLKSKENVLAAFLSEVKEMAPKSEAQTLKETAAELESGVPMYYAEQLR